MITHVAIRFRDQIWSLPRPNRHHHVIRMIVEKTNCETVCDDEQGFLDDTGQFLTREEALKVALQHNQVKDVNDIRCGMLFSEDVW